MPKPLVLSLVTIALIAFASNSLICRQALKSIDESPSAIDANSFTLIRIVSGAVALLSIAAVRHWFTKTVTPVTESPVSAKDSFWRQIGGPVSLLAYAGGFSFAYLRLSAATGALLLFGSVQITMISIAIVRGERITRWQTVGFLMAIVGFVVLLLPSSAAPPATAGLAMIFSGVGWGCYSILGKGSRNPIWLTARNFTLAIPIAVLFWVGLRHSANLTAEGVALAVLSGAVTSGFGYAIWYGVLPQITSLTAASVQLSVPILVAVGGILILGEPIRLSLVLCSVAILSGVAIYLLAGPRPNQTQRPQ